MCANCTSDAVVQGLGVVGAVIMPHNLFLHSGLVLVSSVGCEGVIASGCGHHTPVLVTDFWE